MLKSIITKIMLWLLMLFGVGEATAQVLTNIQGLYNYCPSIIVNEQGEYQTYYCTNEESGKIKDTIYYTKDTSRGVKVLESSLGEWDSEHVSDPAVVKGNFKFANETYNYLMLYTGTNRKDNQYHSIGLAVSKYPDKEWVKVSKIAPFLMYRVNNTGEFEWGYGQPTIVHIGEDSNTYLIYYTVGNGYETYEDYMICDMSDVCNIKVLERDRVSVKGIKRGYISNADIAIDNEYVYMICDKWGADSCSLSGIVPREQVVYRGVLVDNKVDTWEELYIEKGNSISEHHHNSCIIKNENGKIKSNKGVIEIAYTRAIDKENFLSSLWTYRIFKKEIR